MDTLDQQMDQEIMDEELVSSEDEQERVEEEKEKFTNSLKLDQPLPKQVKTVVILSHGTSQSLAQILFYGKVRDLGKTETQYHDKTHETLKIQWVESAGLLLFVPQGALKGVFATPLADLVFGQLKTSGVQYDRIVVLDDVYKTNYSTTDTGYISSLDHQPLRYYKTSFADKDVKLGTFLQKYKPAGVLNLIGGFNAAVLIHAELNGIPAAVVTAIVDSHYVSTETLQAFAPVVHELLDLQDVNLDKIHQMPNFKQALKEANTRDNNIFN